MSYQRIPHTYARHSKGALVMSARSHAFVASAVILFASINASAATTYTFRNVVDTGDGAYTEVGIPQINNAGGIVFLGTLPDGSGGIFTGPNPPTDTVTTTAFNAPTL